MGSRTEESRKIPHSDMTKRRHTDWKESGEEVRSSWTLTVSGLQARGCSEANDPLVGALYVDTHTHTQKYMR